MIASPWDITLTVVFVATGLICLANLVAQRIRRRPEPGRLLGEELSDINHTVMSAAMILMTWATVADAVTWMLIALFAVFALALLLHLARGQGLVHRLDIVGHIVLNVAMIWMLAAMPLLMAGLEMSGDEVTAHAGHHVGGETASLMATPAWVDVTNGIFFIVCAAGALWWFSRSATARGHRLPALCHGLMAAGMTAMLWLMNI